MNNIKAVDVDHAWVQALRLVHDHGQGRTPRGLSCYAHQGPVLITITQPRRRVLANPVRGASLGFMAGEFTWIFTGSNNLNQIAFYNRNMAKYSDDGLTLWGAYGPRFREQLTIVVNKLKADPFTRQAVMTFWRPNPGETKDTPCTVALMFSRQGRFLDLTAVMRSNDLWLGFPYDVFTFTMIQEVIASALNLDVGHYHHFVNDLHYYAEHEAKIEMAMKSVCDSGVMPYYTDGEPHMLEHRLAVFDSQVRGWRGEPLELPTEPLARWLCQRMNERRLELVEKEIKR